MKEKITAIVLAAGQGKRMHSKIQKQFLEIQDHPVLYYSLKCFQDSPVIDDIILVTQSDMICYCKDEIVDHYSFTKVSDVIAGGKNAMILSIRDSLPAQTLIMCLYMMEHVHLLQKKFLSEVLPV